LPLTVFIVLAGLMGASGIILAAAGAHGAPGAGLDSAGYMLLFHAAAVLSGSALVQQGLLWRPLMIIVLAAWVLGAVDAEQRRKTMNDVTQLLEHPETETARNRGS
jgi:hypothetical protein